MGHVIEREVRELLAQSQVPTSRTITEARLAGLPEPVRRYLAYARVIGKTPIRTVRLKQHGAMMIQEGAKWRPLIAEQYFTTNPPAFLWYGTLHPLPHVPVTATDTHADGHGTMVIKALSFIPLGTARGPEADHGELLRYLGETAWFPTALLADYITWEAIDGRRAKATISLPGIAVSAIFHFDEQGRCTQMTAERHRDEHHHLVLRSWMGRWDDYREVHGFRIPMKVEASYTLASGEFTYFRGEVTEIEYDQAAPF
jgi:hypothetical protein